ncbi:MAG: hypothetical protein N2D54_10930 [Chloroflexota bacterium]
MENNPVSAPPEKVDFPNNAQTEKLVQSIRAAGDYILRFQLSSGELAYQIDLPTRDRYYSPSLIRLVAGSGSLYTVCRITEDGHYCEGADRALENYFKHLLSEPDKFDGACLYADGYCNIGSSALAIDAIYRRWQSTGETKLGNLDLLQIAREFGEFINWMRNPQGGFYHYVDVFEGVIDEVSYVVYFNGESAMALMELYEMTGEGKWLELALEINDFMLQQDISQDHWHGYTFKFKAKLNDFTRADQIYATRIAQAIIEDTDNLSKDHSTISTATKIEALSAIALAFEAKGIAQAWLPPAIEAHANFILARQLPNNFCGWGVEDNLEKYSGGIYRNCDSPYIRIDAQQHWINGAALYLTLLSK